MTKIAMVRAREILDSRGNPTLEAEVECEGGAIGVASVPSGASTGSHEAHEKRDGDETRYGGRGVLQAAQNVRTEINAALHGKDVEDQTKIDRLMIELDGTEHKRRLGANAILAASLACARAASAAQGLPLYLYLQQLFPVQEAMPAGRQAQLPIPQMNVINGGKHAHNKLAVQEFQVIPFRFPTFAEALRAGTEIYHALQKLLLEANLAVGLGDEGGFDAGETALLDETEEALQFIIKAIEQAGYEPGVNVALGMDPAASEFYDRETQTYQIDGKQLTAEDMGKTYKTWHERYPILSIEDPFEQEAWTDWKNFRQDLGAELQVVGDDLLATNPVRIKHGIAGKAVNAVLVKPNQIGTLTETLGAIAMTQAAGLNVVVSHRSGETEDSFIADLAVITAAGQIKTGAPARSDRTSKYNRLLAIELASQAPLSQSLKLFTEKMKTRYTF